MYTGDRGTLLIFYFICFRSKICIKTHEQVLPVALAKRVFHPSSEGMIYLEP